MGAQVQIRHLFANFHELLQNCICDRTICAYVRYSSCHVCWIIPTAVADSNGGRFLRAAGLHVCRKKQSLQLRIRNTFLSLSTLRSTELEMQQL